MALVKIDELRRRAHLVSKAAEMEASDVVKQRMVDDAVELLARAGIIEQPWLEMLAGSEPIATA